VQLVLTEDQELIAKTASDFAAQRSPIARVRELRDAGDPVGFSRELWKEMAELGWVGIPFPEAQGGSGLGMAELVCVLEALGRGLAPEPFLSTVLLAGRALLHAGPGPHGEAWIPKIVEGDAVLGLATQEPGSRFDLHRVATRAEKDGEGWRLTGEKTQVLDGHVADALIVPARTSGDVGDADGITLFVVPGDAAGLTRERQHRVDERGAAILRLEGVRVGDDAVLGPEGGGAAVLDEAVDDATVGLCAEMLGGMEQAFAMTLEHLKSREQFGQPIGSFQALKHRAADLYIEIELARSVVMAAARALDAGDEDAPRLVSLAKARLSDGYVHVTNEAVQMFGGVGMTDEYDIGFYMKRARAAELSFGDGAFHRDRWARLSGY
jgi:alkylation response protein AidB-like acyl-CoA dehydrogenase